MASMKRDAAFRSRWMGPKLRSLCLLPFLLTCADAPDAGPEAAPTPRVVSLVPSLGELVIALGGEGHLVARTDYDSHPAILDLPSLGGGLDPNLEKLVETGAELVLTMEGRDVPALEARLNEMGIDLLSFSTNTLPDIHAAIRGLGETLGRQTQADSLSESISRELDEVGEKVEGREPVRVMYVVSIDPPMTAGPGTFIDEMIRMAGGRSVFGDLNMGWPTVSFEAIVDRDPALLIWPTADSLAAQANQLQKMPGWREVPAVRNGAVVRVDPNLFSRPGPNFPEAVRTLAEALHPEAFPTSAGSVP